MKKQKPTAIQYGDLVPDTHLRRRFEGSRELCPEYQGVHPPSDHDAKAVDAAMAECDAAGIPAFVRSGNTFGRVFGEWHNLGSSPSLGLREGQARP